MPFMKQTSNFTKTVALSCVTKKVALSPELLHKAKLLRQAGKGSEATSSFELHLTLRNISEKRYHMNWPIYMSQPLPLYDSSYSLIPLLRALILPLNLKVQTPSSCYNVVIFK